MLDRSASPDASAAGTVAIGATLRVGRMGFGAMRLCGRGVWGRPEHPERAIAVLRRAVELGVTFIDTAEAYGPGVNEEQIAQALYPYPDDLVIATKGGPTRPGPGEWGRDCRPERLKRICDESRHRLKVECIGLYQLHAVDRNVPFEEQIGALKELRDDGKIRFVGLSNVSLAQLQAAQQIVPIASVQNEYNVVNRYSEPILKYCEEQGIVFIPYFPLDGGDIEAVSVLRPIAKLHGATVWQVALAWLLHHSSNTLPIPGTSSLQHLESNIAAASLQLGDDDYATLNDARKD